MGFYRRKFSKISVKALYLRYKIKMPMGDLLYSLRYVIPSLVALIIAYFLLKEYWQRERRKSKQDGLAERLRISLPIRLQAYERIILLLERISPGSLISRLHKPGAPAREFQRLLVQNIRDEFNHNLSQQLYVSVPAWEMVKSAKEEMLSQVNMAAAKLDENATSEDLSNKLLEVSMDKLATRKAIDFLKSEAAKVF
jgi:hypothetical protein